MEGFGCGNRAGVWREKETNVQGGDVSRGKHAVERKRVGGAQTLTEEAMVDMVTSIGIHTMPTTT